MLHHLEQLEGTDDAFRLLHKALSESDILVSFNKLIHSDFVNNNYFNK